MAKLNEGISTWSNIYDGVDVEIQIHLLRQGMSKRRKLNRERRGREENKYLHVGMKTDLKLRVR